MVKRLSKKELKNKIIEILQINSEKGVGELKSKMAEDGIDVGNDALAIALMELIQEGEMMIFIKADEVCFHPI